MKNKDAGNPRIHSRRISTITVCCIAVCMSFLLAGCQEQEMQMETADVTDSVTESDNTLEETDGSVSRDAVAGLAQNEQSGVEENDSDVTENAQNLLTQESLAFPTDAWEMAEKMGVGINLGNTMEAFWEDTANLTSGAQTIGEDTPACYEACWGAVETTQEMVNGMAEAGFSTLRIPVYWGNMMADDASFTIDPDYLDRVAELVTYGLDNGMYVVINIHHYDQFLIEHYPQDRVQEIAGVLWEQIAEYFKEYPEELIFEGYNEALGMNGPEGQLDGDKMYAFVNGMNQTFVDTVRSTGGGNVKRVLIVSGYNTNIDATTDERFLMPEDTAEGRLMVSVHYVDNACFWTNSVGNTAWLDYSRSQCELLKERFLDQGIPVFIGECTAIYPTERFAWDAEVTTSSACLEQILGMIGEYGMVPVLWDTCDQFYLRSGCHIASEEDQAVIDEYNIGEIR